MCFYLDSFYNLALIQKIFHISSSARYFMEMIKCMNKVKLVQTVNLVESTLKNISNIQKQTFHRLDGAPCGWLAVATRRTRGCHIRYVPKYFVLFTQLCRSQSSSVVACRIYGHGIQKGTENLTKRPTEETQQTVTEVQAMITEPNGAKQHARINQPYANVPVTEGFIFFFTYLANKKNGQTEGIFNSPPTTGDKN